MSRLTCLQADFRKISIFRWNMVFMHWRSPCSKPMATDLVVIEWNLISQSSWEPVISCWSCSTYRDYPINILGDNPEGKILAHSGNDHIKPKVRWDKCDLQLYSNILQAVLRKIEAKGPSTLLEIDLTAMALNKLLYDASVASTPKKLNGARKRSRLPVWNDTIAAFVRLSKLAHAEWKEAGSPTIATDLLIKKKAAWRAMKQTLRQQNYL